MRVADLCGLERALARPADVGVASDVGDRRIGALFSDLRIALGCVDDGLPDDGDGLDGEYDDDEDCPECDGVGCPDCDPDNELEWNDDDDDDHDLSAGR